MKQAQERYLGDAVYATFDGYQIWLRTGDGNCNEIALEPEVNIVMMVCDALNLKPTEGR